MRPTPSRCVLSDEPVEDVIAAFERGEKGVTAPPPVRPLPLYIRRTATAVEAMQWLPEDVEHTAEVITWLMHYRRTRFVVEPTSEGPDAKQTIGFRHNGQGWDTFAWPGDWVVRNGPNSYSVYDDDDFKALYVGSPDYV